MNELETLSELQKLCEHIEKNNWEHLYAEPLQHKLNELNRRKHKTQKDNTAILLIQQILIHLL